MRTEADAHAVIPIGPGLVRSRQVRGRIAWSSHCALLTNWTENSPSGIKRPPRRDRQRQPLAPRSRSTKDGSDLLLVQAVFLQRHHPSAEQVDTGAAIHRSLEGLQFVDLSFGLPVVPRLQDSVPNSLQVLAYRPRKTLHRVDPGRACIDQPSIKPLRRSTAKQASKPHRQMPHRGELRRRRLQRIEVGDLPSGHLATGFDAKCRRGQRRDRTTGVPSRLVLELERCPNELNRGDSRGRL